MLEDPAGGSVSTPTVHLGSIATYTCDVGYELNGDPTRTCQSSGEWSGVEPHCIRKLSLAFSTCPSRVKSLCLHNYRQVAFLFKINSLFSSNCVP